MTLYNSFSLQQVLSEAPPSTSDLQLGKETSILPTHKRPTNKVQEEVFKITETVFNNVKSGSISAAAAPPVKPTTIPLENMRMPNFHKSSVPVIDGSEAPSSKSAIPAQNEPHPSCTTTGTTTTTTITTTTTTTHKISPSVTADVKPIQSPYPSKNQQKKRKKKNRQAKKNNARKATEQHNDTPREILDLDFDALLNYHEKAKAFTKEFKSVQPQDKPAVQPESPKHNLLDVAAEILGRPVKRPHENMQQELQKKKQKRNNNNSKGQAQRENSENHNQKQKAWVPMKSCVYFTKGYCKAGDQCTFKHDVPPPEQILKMAKTCQFYKTGSCIKGDECVFSHDLKLEPCRFFHMENKCDNHDDCPYSHDPLNDDSRARLRELTGPCRFYLFKGYCTSGDLCLFSHEDCTEEERKKVESTILACRFYHTTGACRSGDDCFYLHDEASAEQIQKVKQEHGKKLN